MADLLLAFYGDDFTGSTDALQSLALAGLRTVLFLKPPTSDDLTRFDDLDALGLAGASRAMSPVEMEQELNQAFAQLKELNPAFVHYKVCSTFDSSPGIGSIGKAIDVGAAVFESPFVPVLVGVPPLGRYLVFGHLYARAGEDPTIYRIDRHPTMSKHPVTPMDESDLLIHLGKQTDKSIGLFDLTQLAGSFDDVQKRFEELRSNQDDVIFIDGLSDADLQVSGRLLWESAKKARPLFVVGSSGVGYALTAYLEEENIIRNKPQFQDPGPVEKIVAVSGSCSPVSNAQIKRALQQGFAEVPLETVDLLDPEKSEEEISRAVDTGLDALRTSPGVILHTCRGPSDKRLGAAKKALSERGLTGMAASRYTGEQLGASLGRILREILLESGLRRGVVAGGDTSSHAAAQLNLRAVEMTAPLAPGSPLCRAYAPDDPLDGLEIVFKGGQLGGPDIYENVRLGAV